MKDKGQVIRVNCKRCGREMPKWEWLIKREDSHPFPFDSICGYCIKPEEVARHYPNSRGTYLKKARWISHKK